MSKPSGYYRLIVEVGHTGSSYCFVSGVFQTLHAIRAALEFDTQLTVYVIGDRAKLVRGTRLDGLPWRGARLTKRRSSRSGARLALASRQRGRRFRPRMLCSRRTRFSGGSTTDWNQ